MRIIGGQWSGRHLDAPAGRDTRPTSDRVREAIFSSVYSLLGDLEGCVAIDLYAGSGALGLEALSRGAARAYFVESSRKAADVIERNARALGAERDRALLVRASVGPALGARLGSVEASLLLADPPYRIDAAQFSEVLAELAASGALVSGALVVYEHAAAGTAVWPAGFEARSERRYGDTGVSFAVYEGVSAR